MLNADAGVHGHYTVNRAERTDADVRRLRIKKGQCSDCGLQTHKKTLVTRRFVGLNNRNVLDGRCLVCRPLSGGAGGSARPPAPPPGPASVPGQIGSEVAAPPRLPPRSATAPRGLPQRKRFRDWFPGSGAVWGDYVGSLNDRGERHGRGVIKYDNGDEYDGEYKNGKREGRGTLRSADGTVYEGGWKGDRREGRGTFRFAGGEVYDGEYKDGRKEGRGTYRYADGRVKVCLYRANKCIGEGARWSADRRRAYLLKDAREVREISLAEAAAVARRIGLPVPK